MSFGRFFAAIHFGSFSTVSARLGPSEMSVIRSLWDCKRTLRKALSTAPKPCWANSRPADARPKTASSSGASSSPTPCSRSASRPCARPPRLTFAEARLVVRVRIVISKGYTRRFKRSRFSRAFFSSRSLAHLTMMANRMKKETIKKIGLVTNSSSK